MANELNCNKKNYDFWFNILYNFIISLRKWEGSVFDGPLPRCNGTFINRCNVTRGYVFAFENAINSVVHTGVKAYNLGILY